MDYANVRRNSELHLVRLVSDSGAVSVAHTSAAFWRSLCPSHVLVFTLKLLNKRLPTRDALVRRGVVLRAVQSSCRGRVGDC